VGGAVLHLVNNFLQKFENLVQFPLIKEKIVFLQNLFIARRSLVLYLGVGFGSNGIILTFRKLFY